MKAFVILIEPALDDCVCAAAKQLLLTENCSLQQTHAVRFAPADSRTGARDALAAAFACMRTTARHPV